MKHCEAHLTIGFISPLSIWRWRGALGVRLNMPRHLQNGTLSRLLDCAGYDQAIGRCLPRDQPTALEAAPLRVIGQVQVSSAPTLPTGAKPNGPTLLNSHLAPPSTCPRGLGRPSSTARPCRRGPLGRRPVWPGQVPDKRAARGCAPLSLSADLVLETELCRFAPPLLCDDFLR